jgi:hypothetical protein
MYYRMAVITANGDGLKWISTPLASIEALIQLLHRFSVVPQNTMHVFMASSREELNTLLAQENEGLAVHSVSADQFLCERGIGCQEMQMENTSSMQEPGRMRTGTLTPLRPLTESRVVAPILTQQSGNVLESRRVEIEMGEGGDHDQPYTFTLPVSVPQLLAWTKLQVRVLQGELQS